MILDSTSKVIQIVLGEAKTTTDCDISAAWADQTASAFTPGSTLAVSNGASIVTAVAAPGASTQRNVMEVRLHNNDTVTHKVTIQIYDGANTRIMAQQSILAGADFVYPAVTTSAPIGPASGDLSGSYPSPTVAKVNGVAYGSSPTTGTLPLVTSTNTITYTVPNQLPGTATNDSASAGNIGEYISVTVLAGANISLSTSTSADMTSASLTAGDWDVDASFVYNANSSTPIVRFTAWTSLTSATQPTRPNNGAMADFIEPSGYSGVFANGTPTLTVGRQRISLSGTTPVYGSTNCVFSVSTLATYGFMGARRRR